MNPSTTALTLNMQLPNIAAVAWAVQGDMLSRRIEATLIDGSTAWNPPTGADGVIRYFKPDGTNGVYDADEDGNPAVTWTGNVATLSIVQQALTVPGTVLMQLEFYDGNAQRLSTFGWAMNVQPSAVTDNEFLSSDYYSLLSLQIAAVLGSSGHPPYINSTTKNWMIWSDAASGYVDSGFSSVGLTGPAPRVTSTAYQYANSNSGTDVPTTWSDTRPTTVPGTWAWTKTTTTFDTGDTTTLYSAAYQGADGQGSPGSQLPLMDGTAAAGSATAYSREDHVHPSDTSKANQTDLDDLNAALDNLCLKAISVVTVSGNGTTTHTLTGLTADHEVNNWGMFTDADCTTPIPSNNPTCDVTITPSANSWTLLIENFSATFYIRPTFILPQN